MFSRSAMFVKRNRAKAVPKSKKARTGKRGHPGGPDPLVCATADLSVHWECLRSARATPKARDW
jgi:hypothetical protein